MGLGLIPWGFAEDWSSERDLSAFRLGDVLNLQAEVGAHSHVPLRLFVDSCVASLGPGAGTEPHYAIIDFNGCAGDSRDTRGWLEDIWGQFGVRDEVRRW